MSLGPYLLGRRGPGAYIGVPGSGGGGSSGGGGGGGGSGGGSDGGFVDEPVVSTTASGDVTIKGKVKAGSFGKFVYPLAQIQAGRQYTFRYTPHFSQLTKQGKLAMVGFGLKNNNDFHITGLRGDGSTGLHKYKVYGTPPNGWNKQTGHTTSDGGASANGTQAGPNYIRLITSSDGTTYTFQTSGDSGATWSSEFSGATPSPFTSVSGVPTFGIALWFNNADTGPFSIDIDQFADAEAAAIARYWRVLASSNNGDGTFISLGDLEMYSAVYSGANLVTGGTASANDEFSGSFVAANAFDGLPVTTRWACSKTGADWLKYDFGSGNNKQIVGIGVYSAGAGEYDQTMHAISVQYSSDNSNWTTLWTDTLPSFTASSIFARSSLASAIPSYTGSPYGTHTYWRIFTHATVGNGPLSAAEIEFCATPGGADQATGGTPSVSANLVGSASSIFDDNNSTFWAINGGVEQWVQYQFASAVNVAQVTYRIRGDGNPTHAPTAFCVQFSDDGSVWTTAWQVTGQTSWSDGEKKTFTSPDYI